MGGYGSTRWYGHWKKSTVEESITIDVNVYLPYLVKVFDTYRTGTLRHHYIKRYRGNHGTVRVSHSVSRTKGRYLLQLAFLSSNENIEQVINLQFTQRVGGRGGRLWFTCPRCSRRCAKLHIPPRGHRFACRVCSDLTYQSCHDSNNEKQFQKMAEELMKIRNKKYGRRKGNRKAL